VRTLTRAPESDPPLLAPDEPLDPEPPEDPEDPEEAPEPDELVEVDASPSLPSAELDPEALQPMTRPALSAQAAAFAAPVETIALFRLPSSSTLLPKPQSQ
jgi:hypothetical protein